MHDEGRQQRKVPGGRILLQTLSNSKVPFKRNISSEPWKQNNKEGIIEGWLSRPCRKLKRFPFNIELHKMLICFKKWIWKYLENNDVLFEKEALKGSCCGILSVCWCSCGQEKCPFCDWNTRKCFSLASLEYEHFVLFTKENGVRCLMH